jgi:hypothetical protein
MAEISRGSIIVHERVIENDPSANARFTAFEIEGANARQRFREFFRNFRQGHTYIYRDALIRHWNRGEYFVEVDLAHLNEYDDILLNALQVIKPLLCNYP